MRPIDKVSTLLSTAQTPGQVMSALSADPTLLVGLVVLLVIILLIIRILLWPTINPFGFAWVTDIREWFQGAWTWLTTPGWWTVTKKGNYPYAKVIYPTYR